MNIVPSLDPGSPRVRFGAEMRRLREAAQLSQSAVAARLGCTQTQVSRLEKATRSPSRSDAERLDRLFGDAQGVSFTKMYERIIAQPGGPVWFRDWAEEIEPTARILRSWDPLLIPGLLQTESYARSIFNQEPQITPDEVTERAEARMRRQRVLDRNAPPTLLILIEAYVLAREVGSAAVMHEQLTHLLESATRPAVSIQIVGPKSLSGLMGAFMIAELSGEQPDVIHVDSSAHGQITTDPEIVSAIWKRYEAIRLWAYPEHVSLHMIEEARRNWT
ncbi:helix-turn-helix transcriptional regulator [Spongiactinospora sp. TRM90649]|uniref:helix-turn-helix domain-containing protein n=1 Tax=Spongiactinospora sp. TRM90649 TaxID=3031114 RepID=UPI0023F92447|nr:helix-turn-helix transcriptional regulator [Spongiactinospora sp. TRM90649]MDF5755561.1 helix-turn-helix transcriptional regulator [Spongiactinospora sp. TRM90649]